MDYPFAQGIIKPLNILWLQVGVPSYEVYQSLMIAN